MRRLGRRNYVICRNRTMKVSLGVAARDRMFGKAMRRIRPAFAQLFAGIEAYVLSNPIYETLLIGITDDKGDEYLEEVPNNDGFFQVVCGCGTSWDSGPISDADLQTLVLDRIQKAIDLCPLTVPDREGLMKLIEDWRGNVCPNNK
jgi:hypothetical protein